MSDPVDGPDEFTIPRPRWIVPVAVLGALFLLSGLVWAAFFAGESHPEVRFTGATTSVAPTTVTPTSVAPTTTR